jgi:hypothetical protein
MVGPAIFTWRLNPKPLVIPRRLKVSFERYHCRKDESIASVFVIWNTNSFAMHSLFEPATAAEIISRIQKLQPTSPAQWGKMNVSQMLAHCQGPFEVYFKEKKVKRQLMGILFGKMVIKRLLSDKPWRRSLPTAKEFKISGVRNFDEERDKLVRIVNRFFREGYTITSFTHPFFGKLSSQEYALFNYRHLDHHLQQFGV